MENGKPITWFTIDKILPIVIYTASAVWAVSNLKSSVDLLSQKVDQLAQSNAEVIQLYKEVQKEIGQIRIDIVLIKQRTGIK